MFLVRTKDRIYEIIDKKFFIKYTKDDIDIDVDMFSYHKGVHFIINPDILLPNIEKLHIDYYYGNMLVDVIGKYKDYIIFISWFCEDGTNKEVVCVEKMSSLTIKNTNNLTYLFNDNKNLFYYNEDKNEIVRFYRKYMKNKINDEIKLSDNELFYIKFSYYEKKRKVIGKYKNILVIEEYSYNSRMIYDSIDTNNPSVAIEYDYTNSNFNMLEDL